jgi:hypothetical protein
MSPRVAPGLDEAQHEPASTDARRPSLFERISQVRNRQAAQPPKAEEPAPAPQQRFERPAPMERPAMERPVIERPVAERQAAERPVAHQPVAHQPAQPQSPPRVNANAAGSNLTNVRSSDIDLDIPAFLRRQAN